MEFFVTPSCDLPFTQRAAHSPQTQSRTHFAQGTSLSRTDMQAKIDRGPQAYSDAVSSNTSHLRIVGFSGREDVQQQQQQQQQHLQQQQQQQQQQLQQIQIQGHPSMFLGSYTTPPSFLPLYHSNLTPALAMHSYPAVCMDGEFECGCKCEWVYEHAMLFVWMV